MAKSESTACWVSCLFVAPLNWSSWLWTTIRRPLTPPVELAYAANASAPTAAPLKSPAVWVEMLATVTVVAVTPVWSLNAAAGIGSVEAVDEPPGLAVDEHAARVPDRTSAPSTSAGRRPTRWVR